MKRLLSLLLSAALLLGMSGTRALAEGGSTIHIDSAQQLRELSDNCIRDDYSRQLTVILDGDIDLEGQEFKPIPIFSGSFQGRGYAIRNFVLATDGSHQGLFRYLQSGAEIKDLAVEGVVQPENSRCQVGGIVGSNYGKLSGCSFMGAVSGLNYVGGVAGENYGVIKACWADGQVSGKRFTGGIAGYNEGFISDCENYASVNTTLTVGSLEFDSLTLNTLTGASLTGAQDTDVVSDSGGIVGFSTGIVSGSDNQGSVGYTHYGYNVGGIAGRQSGYVTDCVNKGRILGRQDVAGIVGQMEPFLWLKDTTTLAHEVAVLQAMVSSALSNVNSLSAEMEAALWSISTNAGNAFDDIAALGDIYNNNNAGGGTTGGAEAAPAPEAPAAEAPAAEPAAAEAQAGGVSLRIRGLSPARLASETRAFGPSRRLSAADPSSVIGGLIDNASGTAQDIINGNTAAGLDTGALREDLGEMGSDARRFTAAMGTTVDSVTGDFTAISAQLSKVMLMMVNALSGATDLNRYEDVSALEPSDSIQGKVSRCENYGAVDGDSNVGGIAGDMGIEYEFDLENEVMSVINSSDLITSTYETKCVCRDNVNRGSITAKKGHAGGIAGQSQVGIVDACQGYGAVSCAEGGYVGGVVGNSMTTVTGSYAMCQLEGTEYVGGIVGYGVTVQGCSAIVGLGQATACSGAIAGWADISDGKSVSGNVYVGDGQGAVDGISYSGIGEAVSYRRLMRGKDLPEGFGVLKLSFVADGTLVAEIPFEYGGGIDLSLLPQVPEKSGFNGFWEPYNYDKLYFGDEIDAIYTSDQTALAVDRSRDGSPLSIVLVEGQFSDRARLSLTEYAGQSPAPETGTALEQWVLSLEDNGSGQDYSVHYLEPEHTRRHSRIALYRYAEGQWEPVETLANGSYLIFGWDGQPLIFSAVESERRGLTALLYTAATLSAAAVLSLAAVKLLRRRRPPAAEAEIGFGEESG